MPNAATLREQGGVIVLPPRNIPYYTINHSQYQEAQDKQMAIHYPILNNGSMPLFKMHDKVSVDYNYCNVVRPAPIFPNSTYHKKFRREIHDDGTMGRESTDYSSKRKTTMINSVEMPLKQYQGKVYGDRRCIQLDERRKIIATRNIAQGEVILREKPLIGAPMTNEFLVKETNEDNNTKGFRSICLSCSKITRTDHKCCKCGFPMCDEKCAMHPDHADFECEVFATNPVAPIVHVNEYKKIKLLRCLLLREKDPEKWQKIMDLDSHEKIRSGSFCALSTTIALCKFIQQECHLKQYDVETISHVFAVSTVHSINTVNVSAYPLAAAVNNKMTKASLLFYKAGLLTHDCSPNTRCVISQNGTGVDSFMVTVFASIPIPKGEVLTTSFVDFTQGTFQRRADLLENYFFSCSCRRCLDPREHSTFYSALKCPKCPGHLLPGNPLSLDLSSVWLCDNAPRCDFIIVTAQVLELLRAVETDITKAAIDGFPFQEYENLYKVLGKYQGSILHSNHFYILHIKYALIFIINQLLEIVTEEDAQKLAVEQIKLCRSGIMVADVLRPGNNRIRGTLLYFYHEGLLMNFLVDAKHKMADPSSNFSLSGRNEFGRILKVMRMARECLIIEPQGTPEHNKALKLALDSTGMQHLLRYFKFIN